MNQNEIPVDKANKSEGRINEGYLVNQGISNSIV